MTPISVVIPSQNTPELIRRITRCLKSLTWADEAIVVDWNSETPMACEWPRPVRHIIVPTSLAKDRGIFFMEFIAKNVGIRRAKNEWILSMNGDSTLTDPRLDPVPIFEKGNFYRKMRVDVEGEVNVVGINGQVKAGAQNWKGKYTPEEAWEHIDPKIPWTNASGEFMLLHRDDWAMMNGYAELNFRHHLDSVFVCECMAKGLKQVVLPGYMVHLEHVRNLWGVNPVPWEPFAKGNIHLKRLDDWGLAGHILEERP